MKFTKFGLMFASAAIAAGVFADVNNLLISFSTDGDTYADGSPVLPGEWYALCWSPAGSEFGGLNYDCTVVNDGDRLVKLGRLAEVTSKDPYKVGCPFTVFQVKRDDAKELEGGNFYVYLLDTRDASKQAVSDAVLKGGRYVPSEVNGSSASTTAFTAISKGAFDITGAADSAVASADKSWGESVVAGDDVTEAKITKIVPGGTTVEFTVGGLMKGVKYNIKAGETPSTLTSYALDTPRTVSDSAKFEIEAGDARFFKIVREPLNR